MNKIESLSSLSLRYIYFEYLELPLTPEWKEYLWKADWIKKEIKIILEHSRKTHLLNTEAIRELVSVSTAIYYLKEGNYKNSLKVIKARRVFHSKYHSMIQVVWAKAMTQKFCLRNKYYDSHPSYFLQLYPYPSNMKEEGSDSIDTPEKVAEILQYLHLMPQ